VTERSSGLAKTGWQPRRTGTGDAGRNGSVFCLMAGRACAPQYAQETSYLTPQYYFLLCSSGGNHHRGFSRSCYQRRIASAPRYAFSVWRATDRRAYLLLLHRHGGASSYLLPPVAAGVAEGKAFSYLPRDTTRRRAGANALYFMVMALAVVWWLRDRTAWHSETSNRWAFGRMAGLYANQKRRK